MLFQVAFDFNYCCVRRLIECYMTIYAVALFCVFVMPHSHCYTLKYNSSKLFTLCNDIRAHKVLVEFMRIKILIKSFQYELILKGSSTIILFHN